MNSYDLNGRLAVITGGAQGIGFAVAQRFIASGARVMIWDQDDAQGQAAAARLGQGAAAMAVNVADTNAVKVAAEKTKADDGFYFNFDHLRWSCGIKRKACGI